jgi:hypothetical protein
MKKTLIIAALGAMGVLSAGAATTITATNSGGAATKQIQLTLGTPLTAALGGVYEVGVFAGDVFNVSTTLADFTLAGTRPFGTIPGIFGTSTTGGNGVVVDLPNLGEPAGNFVGRPMYVLIRQPGANPEGNFIAFSTPVSKQFAYESALNVGNPVGVSMAELTLVRGQLLPGANTGLTGAAAAGNGGTAVTFIPEPSVALLGALGVLGLLRRRRI